MGQDAIENNLQPEAFGEIENASVAVRNSADYGSYLTDGKGLPLYIFGEDRKGTNHEKPKSKCYSACADSWPPLLTAGRPHVEGNVKGDLLATFKRRDGREQVTYDGWPLYRFVRDFGPEKATGQALEDFGSTWHLVSPSGEPIRSRL
jgi:predicted lipoprotein with Yx(FWY)xxD motif